MPDCSAATIEIGGRIATLRVLSDVADALAKTTASTDWGAARLAAAGWAEEIRLAALDGKTLKAFDAECPNGEFEDLERILRKHALHYHRADDGHDAYPPCNTHFDGGEMFEGGGAIDEGPQILAHTVLALISENRTEELRHLSAGLTADTPPLSFAESVPSAAVVSALFEKAV